MNDGSSERLTAFYRDYLLVIAGRPAFAAAFALRATARQAQTFSADSYYRPRDDNGRHLSQIPRSEMRSQLEAILAAGPVPELAALAERLLALAEAVRPADDGPGDVSPFVYAMF